MTEQRRDIFLSLQQIADEAPGSGCSLAYIFERLDERVFGAALILLALPCSIPFLVGVPQVMAAPILMLTLQMAAGQRLPWLPDRLLKRRISRENLARAAKHGRRWLSWILRFAKPRFAALFSEKGERANGIILTMIASALLVPLPGTDSLPGVAIVIAAVGLTTNDGLILVIGWFIGAAWFLIWALIVFAGINFIA